jgi:hypothetical protein
VLTTPCSSLISTMTPAEGVPPLFLLVSSFMTLVRGHEVHGVDARLGRHDARALDLCPRP